MKILRLLTLGLALAPLAFAAPPRNLGELFGGKANLRLVADAKDVDACVLRFIEPKPRTDGTTHHEDGRYAETAFVALPAATAAALRRAVLDGGSYAFAPGGDGLVLSKFCIPTYQARLRFKQGAETVAVDFCFGCAIARVLHDGKLVSGTDFDPGYPLFRQAFVALFPNDPALQKTKPKL